MALLAGLVGVVLLLKIFLRCADKSCQCRRTSSTISQLPSSLSNVDPRLLEDDENRDADPSCVPDDEAEHLCNVLFVGAEDDSDAEEGDTVNFFIEDEDEDEAQDRQFLFDK
ncbi:hypothetical protein DM02DRAFT_652783 [Periconia macrospinosa]|uniref:Uncharacterized protein n=1 Tax=Periconia macrospinosa TaxID=97972 RepID=A0A2V1DZ41_9PLEO|nr:hypothetical protein DM02DRAFT_652783 [Periconia macrospinosa]